MIYTTNATLVRQYDATASVARNLRIFGGLQGGVLGHAQHGEELDDAHP